MPRVCGELSNLSQGLIVTIRAARCLKRPNAVGGVAGTPARRKPLPLRAGVQSSHSRPAPIHFTSATEEDLEEVKKGQAVAEEMSAGTTAASDEASSSTSSEEELVEYEGMLVSAAAAQRRR